MPTPTKPLFSPMAAALGLSLLAACATSDVRYHKDPGAQGPYSSAVEVGELVLLAGKVGERGQGFAHEVETCIDRIEATLGGVGLGIGDVVEARVYLTDMARYGEFNQLYEARFQDPYPARTCVAVAALPVGAQVEIQVAARHPK